MSTRDDAIEAAARATATYWQDEVAAPDECDRAAGEAAVDAVIPVLLAPLRAVHHERTTEAITDADCIDEACDHDECPTVDLAVCAHCYAIAEDAYPYGAEERIPKEVLWPCATVRLLDRIEGKS